MNKIATGMFAAAALATSVLMSGHAGAANPAPFSLTNPGTTSQSLSAVGVGALAGEVAQYSALINNAGAQIQVNVVVLNPGHVYEDQMTSLKCTLAGSTVEEGPFTANTNLIFAAQGNQTHLCPFFFLGQAATSSKGFVQVQ
jgi:hypothetical protein